MLRLEENYPRVFIEFNNPRNGPGSIDCGLWASFPRKGEEIQLPSPFEDQSDLTGELEYTGTVSEVIWTYRQRSGQNKLEMWATLYVPSLIRIDPQGERSETQ